MLEIFDKKQNGSEAEKLQKILYNFSKNRVSPQKR